MKSRIVVYGTLAGIAVFCGIYWYARSDRPNEVTTALTPLHLAMSPSDFERGPTADNPGQSFAKYKRTYEGGDFDALYVQPLGALDENEMAIVEETAEFLSVFYAAPTKMLEPISDDLIPESARRTHNDREQFSSQYILHEVLRPIRPDDALAVLAITTTDLYPNDEWNFVFGQASLKERIGVWSLHRYGDPETEEFRRRIFKVAIHETGHMFGIRHCVAFECLMNYVNSRLELDNAPMWFCPECVQKVAYARDLDLPAYLAELAEFAEAHGLDEAAEYWSKSHDVLSALP